MDVRLRGFGSIEVEGRAYEHDIVIDQGVVRKRSKKPSKGAVNLAGAQENRGVQGLGGLGVGGMGQAAAVSPVTSFQTANRRVISVR
jgi:hypothetical protein